MKRALKGILKGIRDTIYYYIFRPIAEILPYGVVRVLIRISAVFCSLAMLPFKSAKIGKYLGYCGRRASLFDRFAFLYLASVYTGENLISYNFPHLGGICGVEGAPFSENPGKGSVILSLHHLGKEPLFLWLRKRDAKIVHEEFDDSILYKSPEEERAPFWRKWEIYVLDRKRAGLGKDPVVISNLAGMWEAQRLLKLGKDIIFCQDCMGEEFPGPERTFLGRVMTWPIGCTFLANLADAPIYFYTAKLTPKGWKVVVEGPIPPTEEAVCGKIEEYIRNYPWAWARWPLFVRECEKQDMRKEKQVIGKEKQVCEK